MDITSSGIFKCTTSKLLESYDTWVNWIKYVIFRYCSLTLKSKRPELWYYLAVKIKSYLRSKCLMLTCILYFHSYIYFPSLKNIQSNDTNIMEEVQVKAKPEYVAPPLYKTSKIDNKSNWKYQYTYTILQQQLQTKDKYTCKK